MTSPRSAIVRLTALVLFTALLGGCEQIPQTGTRSGQPLTGPHGQQPLPSPDAPNSEPVLLSGDSPIFSTKLWLNGIRSGYAVLRFVVTKDGRAVRPKAIEYSHSQFAAGVAHVMPTWRFQPARRDGQPVDREVEMRFDFGEEVGKARWKIR